MNLRVWFFGLAALILAAPAEGQDTSKPTPLFEAVWSQARSSWKSKYYHPAIVKVADAADAAKWKSGRKAVRLRVLNDLKADPGTFKPFDVSVSIHLSSRANLFSRPGGEYHLATLYRYQRRQRPQPWLLRAMRYRSNPGAQRGRSYQSVFLVPVDGPTGPLVEAIGELCLGRGASGGRVDRFERMLHYVKSPDRRLRDFASSFAAVNGMGLGGVVKHKEQTDAFVRALLEMQDAPTRRRMARAFTSVRADMLPHDPELLRRLLTHRDSEVLTPLLRDNLRYAGPRARQLAGPLRSYLSGPAGNAENRWFMLRAITHWGEHALVLRDELETMALGRKAPPADEDYRRLALRILLDGNVDNGAELVAETLVQVPSAVALQYATVNDIHAIVPAVIEAVREGTLTWTEAHSAALSLLTRRCPGGRFADFDRWWAKIEKQGRAEAMVKSGFVDPSVDAAVRRLIGQLGHRLYRQRQAARTQLAKLAMLKPPSLVAATGSTNLEIATSAAGLIAAAEKAFDKCRDTLAKRAKIERNIRTPLTKKAGLAEAKRR